MGDLYENMPSCPSKRKCWGCKCTTNEGGRPANFRKINDGVRTGLISMHPSARLGVSILWGRALVLAAFGSSLSGPDRKPALFREFRPRWFAVSLRILFEGRTDDAIGRSDTVFGGSFALEGGFGFVADGKGDALSEVAPLV